MAASRSIMCGALISGFSSPPPPSLLSTVYQCDRCLSPHGRGGSWLGCQVLPAIGAVSILELAAKSGSSRMSQATQPPQSDKVVYIILISPYILLLFNGPCSHKILLFSGFSFFGLHRKHKRLQIPLFQTVKSFKFLGSKQ